MSYIVEGEVVDTYGGDYTYRDVWCEYVDDGFIFYERCYGAKPSDTEVIDDIDTINELKRDNDIPKEGDKIIWDSGSGYDIGFYISDKSNQYFHCTVKNISNKYVHETSEYTIGDVIIYNEKNIKKMIDKYGYEHRFEDYE